MPFLTCLLYSFTWNSGFVEQRQSLKIDIQGLRGPKQRDSWLGTVRFWVDRILGKESPIPQEAMIQNAGIALQSGLVLSWQHYSLRATGYSLSHFVICTSSFTYRLTHPFFFSIAKKLSS